MAYNITSWTIKVMSDLIIPIDALYGSKTWNPPWPTLNLKTASARITYGEDSFIEGLLRDTNDDGIPDEVIVVNIRARGEYSGHIYSDSFVPALRKSKGYLVATVVWEGGDSITRLEVKDGYVTEEQLDLGGL